MIQYAGEVFGRGWRGGEGGVSLKAPARRLFEEGKCHKWKRGEEERAGEEERTRRRKRGRTEGALKAPASEASENRSVPSPRQPAAQAH